MDGEENLFPANTSIATDHHSESNHYEDIARHEGQDGIIRNDKLLTDGNCQTEKITYPDSSTFTLNQNVHDSLWPNPSALNHPPPPPMTCMAPMLGTSGSNAAKKIDHNYPGSISKIEAPESLLHDTVGLSLSSPPASSSWLGT